MLKNAILFHLLTAPKNKKGYIKKPEQENHSIFTDTVNSVSSYISGLFSNSSNKNNENKENDQEKLTERSKRD